MSRTDKRSWQPYLVLALGVLAVSWAAIFIRLATAPALVTGAYRLTLASLILTPLALWRNGGELLHLDRRDLWLMAHGAGYWRDNGGDDGYWQRCTDAAQC